MGNWLSDEEVEQREREAEEERRRIEEERRRIEEERRRIEEERRRIEEERRRIEEERRRIEDERRRREEEEAWKKKKNNIRGLQTEMEVHSLAHNLCAECNGNYHFSSGRRVDWQATELSAGKRRRQVILRQRLL